MADLQTLANAVGSDNLSTDDETRTEYGRDWTRYVQPEPLAVVFPRSTAHVQEIVHWARKEKVGIVPSGGRTGLSGGAVAAKGELVVSFAKMQRILELSRGDAMVHCEAGVITETLQKYALDNGFYYPVDFASRGSSAIGGNIATNAGGIKVLRYGLTREWVAGLIAVTGTGEVLDLGKGLIKNATGYDLRHLFIGSEGTLGLVTHATIRLTRPPQPQRVLFMGAKSPADIMKVFDAFRGAITLSAFEVLNEEAMQGVNAKGLARPLGIVSQWYILVEHDVSDNDRALEVFEKVMNDGLVVDGVVSESSSQATHLWRLREDITEALAHHTPYKNDVSVMVSRVPAFLADADAVLKKAYPTYTVVWFGHIGDGNLHISILKPKELPMEQFYAACQRVDTMLFDVVKKHGGSVSAEHGVGTTKKPFLSYTRSAGEIVAMRAIKKVFDPDGILNPGKMFD